MSSNIAAFASTRATVSINARKPPYKVLCKPRATQAPLNPARSHTARLHTALGIFRSFHRPRPQFRDTGMNRRHVLIGGGALALAGGGAAYAGLRQMGSMSDYEAEIAAARTVLDEHAGLREIIRYATLAPNGHNTQPWQFRIDEGGVAITPDFTRRTPVVDPDDHHLFVSLGCVGETLALAACARGHSGTLGFDPHGAVTFTFGDGPNAEAALFDAIPRRQSTRADYDGRAVSLDDLTLLAGAAAVPGVDVVLITGRPQMDQVRDLVIAGNTAQMASPEFVREIKSWLRFSPRQAIETGDGLFSAASGKPPLPPWLGPSMVDWFFNAAAENDTYARQMRSSSGVAVLVAAEADPEHWVRAGRACQRFLLQATALGLKCAFMNQPVEVAPLRPELAAVAGLPGRRPDLVIRFGYGPMMPFSARRPLNTVIV